MAIPGPKGPRYLTVEQETELFESLKTEASEGALLNAGTIKARFEEKAGRAYGTSTIYWVI